MRAIRSQLELIMIFTLLGIVPALFYYIVHEREIYLGLSWNVFLALLPFGFAIKAVTTKNRYVRYITAFLWLIFLPNSPYLLTDIIHVQLNPNHQGFVFYLVSVLSFTGLLSWFFSVRLVLGRMFISIHKWNLTKNHAYILLCILSAVGVAMGRFARLNSWEIISNPLNVVKSTVNMYADWLPWFITLTIGVLLLILKDLDIGKIKLNLKPR